SYPNSAKGAYPGTCRDKQIPYETENASWRLRADASKWPVAALPVSMRDFIIRRKDGLPSYQLASLIDDLHFGVNLVVRGEDLWESTLAQIYLAGILEQAAYSVTPLAGSATPPTGN